MLPMRLLASGAAITLIACLPAVTSCKRSEAKPEPGAPPPPAIVEVTDVVQRDEPQYEEWIASLDGLVNAQIRAQVSGYLLRQAYTDGAEVKKGDLLFEIDPRTFQATYAQAKANFDKTRLDLERSTTLLEKNVASKQERDNAEQAHASAAAALDQAKLNLEFTRITSPIDGIAGIATAQLGDLVGPNSGILTTVSTVNPIKAYFAISEQSYLAFKHAQPGQPRFPDEVTFELVTGDGEVYPPKGKFLALDREIDAATGTLRVAVTFPNPDRLLRPGEHAHVRALVSTTKGALLVPQRAVSEMQGQYQVAIVDRDNHAHIRQVTLGSRTGPSWIVKSGLKPGDRVIVEGAQKVREGTPVSPQPFSPPSATGK